MKKLILILILSVLMIPMIFAEVQTLGIFKIDQCIKLKQSCSNCTYNNISSVIYPNSTAAISEVQMTKSGTEYNYTFCNATVLGKYIVNGFGDVDGVVTVWAYDFTVTNTGYQTDISQSIIIFFIFGVMIIIGLGFLVFGLKTEIPGAKIFSLSMSVIMIVFLVGYIVNITNVSLGEFPTLTSGFNVLYILFIALLTVGGMGLVVYLVAYSLDSFYKSRGFRD